MRDGSLTHGLLPFLLNDSGSYALHPIWASVPWSSWLHREIYGDNADVLFQTQRWAEKFSLIFHQSVEAVTPTFNRSRIYFFQDTFDNYVDKLN